MRHWVSKMNRIKVYGSFTACINNFREKHNLVKASREIWQSIFPLDINLINFCGPAWQEFCVCLYERQQEKFPVPYGPF